MKIAIVTDWLIDFGGAELVVKKMHELFPEAPIYTCLYDKEKMKPLGETTVIPSWMQKIPYAYRIHRFLPFLMPFAFASFNLKEYDLIISSTHSFSKNLKKLGKNTKFICYCHTPTRYLWDEFGYVKENAKWWQKPFLPFMLWWLRKIDYKSAQIPDVIYGNSSEACRRIRKFYHRDCEILFPPVEIDKFEPCNPNDKKDYFICGGRLVPYKRYDLAIKACNELGKILKIFGTGPDMERLKSIAGPTIEFLGRVSDEDRKRLYREAKAFINPQLEDFGITALEAQASGTPVIAYKKGGALDTVIEGKTGIFFNEQTEESLVNALKNFDSSNFSTDNLLNNAKRFGEDVFKQNVQKIVDEIKSLE